MAEALRLYGLKALVTSAGDGIGEAVARTLVKHGAEVLAVDGLNSGVERLFSSVRGITGHAAELRDPGRMPALVEEAAEKLGAVDIVINDFPIAPESPIAGPGGELDKLVEARADLIMTTCRSALPHMKKSPAGRIVNVGFLRSVFSADGSEASAAAERDLAAITRALAAETAEFGITANYVQPGAIMTATSAEVWVGHGGRRQFRAGRRSGARDRV